MQHLTLVEAPLSVPESSLGHEHSKLCYALLNLASVTDFKKEFTLHTVYAVVLEATKPLQLIVQEAEFKLRVQV